LYEKYNNYGEFVFDHVWHNAYEKYGLNYYPKLVSAIPYTPASGVRFLAKKNNEKRIFPMLLDAIVNICEKLMPVVFIVFSLKMKLVFLKKNHFSLEMTVNFTGIIKIMAVLMIFWLI
jgi:Uncharacterized protein conserved in bacteria